MLPQKFEDVIVGLPTCKLSKLLFLIILIKYLLSGVTYLDLELFGENIVLLGEL